MTKFLGIEPTPEDYWRSLVLFGRNVACYKLALAKVLIELIPAQKNIITLEELAVPYARQIVEHLQLVDKQSQSPSSSFLDSCRQFNQGLISHDELIAITIEKGFINVLDAFHNLSGGAISQPFFDQEQWKTSKKITLTDTLFELTTQGRLLTLNDEAEARWRLVETSWQLNISKNLIAVDYDPTTEVLFTRSNRRVDITSCRQALNGYQKGKCFYCFRPISLEPDSPDFMNVDHFIPHTLGEFIKPINGVWNLVLACIPCNRGVNGKSDRLPHIHYLERLYQRNEYFIESEHPIKISLIQQTGKTSAQRVSFLQSHYNQAQRLLGVAQDSGWRTLELGTSF